MCNEVAMIRLQKEGKVMARDSEGHAYLWLGLLSEKPFIRVLTGKDAPFRTQVEFCIYKVSQKEREEGREMLETFFSDFLNPTESELFFFEKHFGFDWNLHKVV